MQKSTTLQKLITLFAVFAVAIVAAVAVFLSRAFFASAEDNTGEGNNSGGGEPDISIVLDVNGRDASHASLNTLTDNKYDELDDNNDFVKNDRQHLKVRSIGAQAVVQAYNHVHDANKSFIDYHFRAGSIVYDCTEINVAIASDDTSRLIVTALAKTRIQRGVRFSVVLENTDNSDSFPAYFQVTVNDTFAHKASVGGITFADSFERLRVGGKVENGVEQAAEPLVLHNYSDWKFQLKDYLVGRALYVKSSSNDDYTKAVKMADSDAAPYWTVSSVNNFTVQDIKFDSGAGFTNKSINNPTKDKQHSAAISAMLSLPSDTIAGFVADKRGSDPTYTVDKFWTEKHDVLVELNTVEDSGRANLVTVLLPVKLRADKPQKTAIPSAYLNLTVTSGIICDYSGGNGGAVVYKEKDNTTVIDDRDRISREGFGSIIIRPRDLVDYSFPSKNEGGDTVNMTFDKASTSLGSESGDYMLEPLETEEELSMYPNAYRVIALKNNQYAISFGIRYYVEGKGYEIINVLVSVIGDGAYVVSLPTIEGKSAVTYNVRTSSYFKQLRDAKYIMTDATSNNKSQLRVTLKNNELELKPNADKIKGTTRATITMTFTNTNGQTLVITSNEFGIDVDAGSFWSRFEDWQAWLIIAACIIGGIAIILLIVWLFIRAISKRREAENATAAPVSSYIVKLNSTIAATQAQQRLAATQALSQASSQMLLGAGPTSTPAAAPDTLQLATGIPSTPASASDGVFSEPAVSTPKEPEEDYNALIAQYISDEELLERIFVEKYEPKGMVRRTFFKSKDLQARELDKEKNRIIERYKTPMPMDEAIMSEAEISKSEEPVLSTPQEEEEQPPQAFVLDFDPYAPLYVETERPKDEFSDEKIEIDVAPEESALRDAEHRDMVVGKELEELELRLSKIESEISKNKTAEDALREKIAKAEADDEKYGKEIEDLEFKLASAKQKEKDRITRDINTSEAKKKRNLESLEKLRAELDVLLGGGAKLDEIHVMLDEQQKSKLEEQSGIAADLEKARSDYSAYQDRLAKVKARQELESKIEELNPMLVAVNTADYEMRDIDNTVDKLDKERESLKSEVAAAKSQILGATGFDVINELNTKISDSNARLSEIEREVTKVTKRRSELNIDFTSQRRKANDYIAKNEIPLEDVISAEDLVVGNIELDNLRAMREKDRELAEAAVAAAQAEFDDISASSADVTMVAMEIASEIQQLEADLEVAQGELDAVNAQMETASDDEKLMLMVDQGDKSDKVDELKAKIEQINVEGTKRKIEAQSQYDERVEAAHAKLDEASDEFKAASAKYDVLADTNPLDLIMSGSGIISQDQKKIEATNLKKQLEKSKNEIEQARLAAEMAQMEAEQARVDAARASDEARAEAERVAQEAIEKADAARLEAEEKARKEAEAAEQARREAEGLAEQAQRDAEERAEAAQAEAEAARREAEEAVERARREAEESLQAEAEEARRKAQEEIEQMRRKAEEEAEAKRLEEEQAKREEQERLKAEAERRDAVAAKVAARKEKIVVIRERMKDIKGDEDAKNLREQLYTMQLTFDEDEKGSTELMDFYNKTMDDIQHAGEVATLKAENAKKPQRIVKKVTERVNRIPKKKPRPGARPGARPAGARPSARPGARPAARPGARPAGARPGARPAARPGARPSARPGTRPGTRPPRSR